MREARIWRRIDKTRLGIVVLGKRNIERFRIRALLGQVGQDLIAQGRAGHAQGRIARMHGFDLDRDIGFELGAVGDVQVDIGQRIPGVHQRQHVLHLGRIGLHVFAVQIIVLRRAAPAHFHGAALVRPIPLAEALVAINVKHGHEQQHLFVERAGCRLALQYFAQREETRILAIDFARMDAALYQQHGQLAARRFGRRQGARIRDGQRQHGAVFRRAAELHAAHLLRIA
ncbi:hypothetical protein D3C72_1687560 [compost metagenome]